MPAASNITPDSQQPAQPRRIWKLLLRQHPKAVIELDYSNPVELLIAVILSAQCTDRRVNQVTARLFKRFPGPLDYVHAPVKELEDYLHPLGFFRQKTKFIQEAMYILLRKHNGLVPRSMEELLELPGVGRKTANVVLSNAFGITVGIAVDTHVKRVSRRLGWTKETDPDRIEQDLQLLLPQKQWGKINHVLVLHGRYICRARRPDCAKCLVNKLCPSSQLEQDHKA